MRLDLTLIQPWIADNSRVLDIGCGDGTLLHLLRERGIDALGVEIDPTKISACIRRGLSVVEHNLDHGLQDFQSDSFDTVVMTHALQTLRYPHRVIDDMLRVGRECIITFPNFGYWGCRWYLGTQGRMPVSKFLPYTWYDTPNIHFCTVQDFEALCQHKGIRILNRAMVGANNRTSKLAALAPNLFSLTAVYHISR